MYIYYDVNDAAKVTFLFQTAKYFWNKIVP